MSLTSRRGLLERIRRGKKARADLVASNLSEGVAFQIKATRDARQLTQEQLAEAAGMSQNNLSRLENPDYGKHTVSSLKRIADALDVALIVRFVPYSQYIDWLSATPRTDPGLTPGTLAVPSFGKEEAEGAFNVSTSSPQIVANGGNGASHPGHDDTKPGKNACENPELRYPNLRIAKRTR